MQKSIETRKKISNSLRFEAKTELHKKKISESLSGKPKSKEHKRKISESMKKRNKILKDGK